jgi:hypothetical protein
LSIHLHFQRQLQRPLITRVTRWWGSGRLCLPEIPSSLRERRPGALWASPLPQREKSFFGGLQALQTTRLAGDRISRVIRAIQAGIAFQGFFMPHEGSRWSHLHHARKDKFAKGKALARAPLQPPCSGVVLTLQTGSDSL